MLPEQVWDYADMPSEDMYCGRSAGSAQPLVWAHAEYIKLLRSVADGHVFDRIPIVEARYAVLPSQRTFQSRLEVFQTGRPISAMAQGSTLRIVDANHFTVVWTSDNWATTNHLDSRLVGRPGFFADIQAVPGRGDALSTNQNDAPSSEPPTSLIFTLHWPEADRWLGHNIEIAIHTETPSQVTAAEKPKS
jgi:glucoamylase